MAAPAEIAVPLERIAVSRNAAGTVAVIGNPNAGKSSVFNRLTGLRQHTANYPGVTVERRVGPQHIRRRGARSHRSARHVFVEPDVGRRAHRSRRTVRPRRGHGASGRDSRRHRFDAPVSRSLSAAAARRARQADDRRVDDDRRGRTRRAQDRLGGAAGRARRRAGVSRRRHVGPRVAGAEPSARQGSSRYRRRVVRPIGPSSTAPRTRSSRACRPTASSCTVSRPSGF